MRHFTAVTSFEDLKKQYRALAIKNHPDMGGRTETMQEINNEYDILFMIWKVRDKVTTEETADSTRSKFYTQNGWKGSRHDWNRSLKDVAQIVRAYVKAKYPTYKFSVRTSYASMCQELHVALAESPVDIYKSYDQLTSDDKNTLRRRMMHNNLFKLSCWDEAALKTEFERIWKEKGNFYKCINDVTQAVIDDVDRFVESYNYKDCDGQMDYFNVDFYYFGCVQNNGADIKIVPKTARVAPKNKKAASEDNTSVIAGATAYLYKIVEDQDTRDGSTLWVVKFINKLSRDEYLCISDQINSADGYYSKYKHGFIFRYDPKEALKVMFPAAKENAAC